MGKKKILVVGSGGREHALAWKAARSDDVEKVFVAPGNAGTFLEPGVENAPLGNPDPAALVRFAKDNEIDLTIVGPEAPLVAGIVDTFNAAGLSCFGPSQKASMLEGSKAFTKEFLKRHHIPTAGYRIVADPESARESIRDMGVPVVVKADGLAAGKGVVVAQTQEEAMAAVEAMMVENRFGEAGKRVVLEECLVGEEASFIVMVDGENILPLATSQDHKARDDGDRGPNTGGMGAYSPAPVITPRVYERVMRQVIEPTVRGMAADGHPYLGFLYAGLMIDREGTPRVLEYNCRFGDPETQPILLRLRSDLVELCTLALDGRLDSAVAHWDERASLGVVMTAGGYPESYRKGDVITGLFEAEEEGLKVFHAGTRMEGDRVVTNGGRVLCVTALGETVTQAKDRAYSWVERIRWRDCYYRKDIGYRAVAREQS